VKNGQPFQIVNQAVDHSAVFIRQLGAEGGEMGLENKCRKGDPPFFLGAPQAVLCRRCRLIPGGRRIEGEHGKRRQFAGFAGPVNICAEGDFFRSAVSPVPQSEFEGAARDLRIGQGGSG
jgi:hypothetical protein